MKNKNVIIIIGLLIAIVIFLILLAFKCFIDMFIYSECLKHSPQVFYNNPICIKYRNY